MTSHSDHFMDKTNNETSRLHNQLLCYIKESGLTESSIAILHKISHIINSIMTSISILEVKMQKNSLHNLFKTIELLKDNQKRLTLYLNQDPIVSKIPEYLILLGNQIQVELQEITKEIHHALKNIKHIKNLVHTYKTSKHIYAYKTKVMLSDVIERTIKCFSNLILENNITINKDYKDCKNCSYLFTDQEKLTQILMHLISNAIDSLIAHNQTQKNLNIYINQHTNSLIKISIQDNGVGIDLKHLEKIFTFGFTTKINGHGFNLYNSYIKSKELGGILRAMSPGCGLGAIFTLILPYNFNCDKR